MLPVISSCFQMSIADLISSQGPQRSLDYLRSEPPKESAKAESQEKGAKAAKDEHEWLDPRLIEKLPVNIRKGGDSH